MSETIEIGIDPGFLLFLLFFYFFIIIFLFFYFIFYHYLGSRSPKDSWKYIIVLYKKIILENPI